MKYPLARILGIKKRREEAARTALLGAKRALAEAKRQEQLCRDAVAAYRRWRPVEEARLLDAIKGRVVEQDRLREYNSDITVLRAEEARREAAQAQAVRGREAAEQGVDRARTQYQAMQRETRKIEEHRAAWQKQAQREAERREEKELEDFHGAIVSAAFGEEEYDYH